MQVALLLAAPFVVSSCDDVIGQEDNPVASYVQWKTDADKAEIELGVGKTYTRTATAVSSAIIAYSSDDEKIATVDPVSGEVKGVAVGETNINAEISGMSTNGRSVFEATKISYKVKVVDLKAKLTRKVDSKVVYNADADSIVKLSDLFTFYPALGADGATNITVELCKEKKESATAYAPVNSGKDIGVLVTPTTATTGVIGEKNFKITGKIDNEYKAGDITDTLYIAAKINAVNTTEGYEMPTTGVVSDTVMVIVTKSIAYINAKGKREILTADKYKTPDFSKALEAGTYYIPAPAGTASTPIGNLAVKGDVTLIFADGYTGTKPISATSISDQTDKATLNIFGEAIDATSPATPGKYKAASPTINVNATAGDAISNFAEINFYTGAITATSNKEGNGAFVKVKNLNVFGGTLKAEKLTNKGYAISLLEGGKLTVKGGTVTAIGYGTDVNLSYGIIGDVEVAKGSFLARSDYRAVKGSLTAGEGLEFVESNDPTATTPTWTKITGTTSNEKGIKIQAKK